MEITVSLYVIPFSRVDVYRYFGEHPTSIFGFI
jgi:hypothetical protein